MSAWKVVQSPEFGEWFLNLPAKTQKDIYRVVRVLSELGPMLGRPYVDSIKESGLGNLKELRVQSGGRPIRVLFAFDHQRTAVLLIGDDKSGKKKFYPKMIYRAEILFYEHLERIK